MSAPNGPPMAGGKGPISRSSWTETGVNPNIMRPRVGMGTPTPRPSAPPQRGVPTPQPNPRRGTEPSSPAPPQQRGAGMVPGVQYRGPIPQVPMPGGGGFKPQPTQGMPPMQGLDLTNGGAAPQAAASQPSFEDMARQMAAQNMQPSVPLSPNGPNPFMSQAIQNYASQQPQETESPSSEEEP